MKKTVWILAAVAVLMTLVTYLSSKEPVPAVEEFLTAEEHYAVVIGEYYTALSEKWDAAELMEKELNYMVADCHHGQPLEEIGYAIIDLNGDGTEELLIGSKVEDDFFGKMIFSLYTLDTARDNAPMLVFDSSERDRYYYAGENRFAHLGANSAEDSFNTTARFENGKILDQTGPIASEDYVQAELTPFSEWVQ
ncbi:MAG: hypothetical protein ACI4PQ_08600 [Butyricicoccaceae bacterium]